jgi:transmembrane sensor
MDEKEFTVLVKKYLSGSATDAEKRFIEAYYSEQDSGKVIDEILDTEEVELTGREIMDNIQLHINKKPDADKIRRLDWRKYFAVAAMFAVIVSISVWFFMNQNSKPGNLTYNSYFTKRGSLNKLILTDGTIVWLNADSKFRCPQSFDGAATREVYLEGEAYFEVAKDKKHPFLVHTRNLITRVLGTKFDVNAYHTNKTIEVTLLEGKVMLTTGPGSVKDKKQDTLYLKPSEKGYFNESGAMMKTAANIRDIQSLQTIKDTDVPVAARGAYRPLSKISLENAVIVTSWKDGRLVFDQEPLENVIAAIGRKYDVTINAKTSLLNFPVSLNFGSEPLEEVLLEVTKQLKHDSLKGNAANYGEGQFKKVGSKYYIE